jgi:hypothetical protein
MKSYMVSQIDPRHPADELLLALIHEQSFNDAAAIRGHLSVCAACVERSNELAANDATIASLLASLDHPLQPAALSFTGRHAGLIRRAALVAGAVATMAGAAAALVPSSPLHKWIVAGSAPAAASKASATTPSIDSTVPATAGTAETPLASGIAVPAKSVLVIEFRREQDHGVVEINRSADGDVVFRSRGGTTAYDVAEGRVSIDNQTPADVYLIDAPVNVHQIRIKVGSRTVIRWPEDSAKYTLSTDSHRARVELRIP